MTATSGTCGSNALAAIADNLVGDELVARNLQDAAARLLRSELAGQAASIGIKKAREAGKGGGTA